MKALLLAAGRGTRISRHLGGKPKCLVDIGGISLLKYSVELLRSRGIEDIAIVLGYNEMYIRDELKGLGVSFFYNPLFDITNSIVSLWFAREFISNQTDLMIMNADVYIEQDTLDVILASQYDRVVFADSLRKIEADYKLKYEGNALLKYGKELQGEDVSGEYIGIGKISSSSVDGFVFKLESMINNQQHSLWWENVLYNNNSDNPVNVTEITGQFWAEVDYIEDYSRILTWRGQKELLSNFSADMTKVLS